MTKFLSIFSISVFAFAFSISHTTTYKVDTTASTITWVGKKVTGTHTGTVNVKNGTLLVDHGTLTGGSFEIDMKSMKCTDLEGESANKLVGHLGSADFFGIEKYPMASFTITKAIPTDTKGNYKIVGNMKIKETTKEVKFYANLATDEKGNVTAKGDITIDRSDFDIRYGSGSFFDNLGDKTIYDEFDLSVSLACSK